MCHPLLPAVEEREKISVAAPAEPRGEKNSFSVVQILGGEKLLKFVEEALSPGLPPPPPKKNTPKNDKLEKWSFLGHFGPFFFGVATPAEPRGEKLFYYL